MENTKKRGSTRRLLSVFMSLALVFSAIPAAFFPVYAANPQSDLTNGSSILSR